MTILYDELMMQCMIVGECFVLAGKDGWDTKNFIHQLFYSEWGRGIITGTSYREFACPGFMYEGLLRELKFTIGAVYPEKILDYAGFLYRYLGETCGTRDIYRKAKIDILDKRFGFYHTQGWEYIKMDLGL